MFRLREDGGVVNRYGFNSEGAGAVAARLAERAARGAAGGPGGLLGVNLGKNKEGDAVSDYVAGVAALAPFADYLVVNVSSPNTPGLRALQGRAQLRELLTAVKAARDGMPWGVASTPLPHGAPAEAARRLVASRARPPPLLVKVAPDLTEEDMQDVAAVVLETGLDGVVCTNTTVAR